MRAKVIEALTKMEVRSDTAIELKNPDDKLLLQKAGLTLTLEELAETLSGRRSLNSDCRNMLKEVARKLQLTKGGADTLQWLYEQLACSDHIICESKPKAAARSMEENRTSIWDALDAQQERENARRKERWECQQRDEDDVAQRVYESEIAHGDDDENEREDSNGDDLGKEFAKQYFKNKSGEGSDSD